MESPNNIHIGKKINFKCFGARLAAFALMLQFVANIVIFSVPILHETIHHVYDKSGKWNHSLEIKHINDTYHVNSDNNCWVCQWAGGLNRTILQNHQVKLFQDTNYRIFSFLSNVQVLDSTITSASPRSPPQSIL
jgi:hypothetical protein